MQLKNEGISLDLLNKIIGENTQQRQLIFELTNQPGFSADSKKLYEISRQMTESLENKLSIPVTGINANLFISFRRIKVMPLQNINNYMLEHEVEFKGSCYKNYLRKCFKTTQILLSIILIIAI